MSMSKDTVLEDVGVLLNLKDVTEYTFVTDAIFNIYGEKVVLDKCRGHIKVRKSSIV